MIGYRICQMNQSLQVVASMKVWRVRCTQVIWSMICLSAQKRHEV